MACRILSFLLALSFCPAWAGPDRRPLVEAAFKKLLPLVKYWQTEQSQNQDKKFLADMVKILEWGHLQLVFSKESQSFILKPGEAPRLMGTSAALDVPIYVNEELLNSPSQMVDLPLLFQLLFHEVGHKTASLSLERRDFLAGQFASSLRAFVQKKQLGEASSLVTFSLPAPRIGYNFMEYPADQAYPSNIILLNRSEVYEDLTPSLEEGLSSATIRVRGIWTEVNRIILEFIDQIMGSVRTGLGAGVDATIQGLPLGESGDVIRNGLKEFLEALRSPLHEVRRIEFQGVDALTQGDGSVRVRLKGTYEIARGSESQVKWHFDGFDLKEIVPVPLIIEFVVSEKSSPRVEIFLRPEMDYSNLARVKSVVRGGGNLKLRVEYPAAGRRWDLEARFFGGSMMIAGRPSEVPGQLEFEIPAFITRNQNRFFADSVLVDGEKGFFLDRSVELNAGVEREAQTPGLRILPKSIGLWGEKNGRPFFQKDFSNTEAIFILPGMESEHFSFDPSQLNLEFQLNGQAQIRQVKVNFSRFLARVEPKSDEVLRVEVDGEEILLATGESNLLEQSVRYESLTLGPEDLELIPGDVEGDLKVRAKGSVLFKKFESKNPGPVAMAPPLLNFISLEVVTENLAVLRTHFDGKAMDTSFCSEVLEGKFSGHVRVETR